MKKFFLMGTFLLCGALFGCGATTPTAPEAETLSVVTTQFPYYDFARTIAGERAEVTFLLSGGAESHSFEPTAQDVVTISSADLFLYTGASSEHWVEEILDSLPVDQHRVAMLQCIETPLYLPEDDDHDDHDEAHEHDDHDEAHEHDDHDHDAPDEHIWTSPKNAIAIANQICGELTALDLEGADTYAANTEALIAELTELDQQFSALVAEAPYHTMVFGDRFPLLYFTTEYGLDWQAAFDGCSEDTEPSVARLAELIDFVQKNQIPAVYHLELSNASICETIAEATGCAVLQFHGCHNITAEELTAGVHYCDLMRENLTALSQGLYGEAK